MQRITRRASTGYVSQKKKVKESVPLQMNKNGNLVSTDEEKVEALNKIFASVFTGNLYSHTSPVDELQDGGRGTKVSPSIRENQIHDHQRNLNI